MSFLAQRRGSLTRMLILLALVPWLAPRAALGQLRLPLQLQCPANLRVQTCGTAPVPVTYPLPTVRTGCNQPPKLVCTPPSGSVFPMGTTRVTCVATDACGDTDTCTFTVTVERDTTAPVLRCPENLTVRACQARGVGVLLPAPVVEDDSDPSPTVEFVPPSGSLFPVGTTTVLCVARDACGNRSRCTFTVTVTHDPVAAARDCGEDAVDGEAEPAGPANVESAETPFRVEDRGGSLRVSFDARHELLHSPSLDGPWQSMPLPGAGHTVFDTLAPSRYFLAKPRAAAAGSPWSLPDPGFTTDTETAYVQTGPFPTHETFGAQLPPSPLVYRHSQADHDPSGGEIVHRAEAGGLDRNTWSPEIRIPFGFRFYGEAFDTFCVSKNGLLTFTTSVAGQPAFQPGTHSWPLPRPGIPDRMVFCFYGRFNGLQPGQHVRAWLHGTAPRRQVWIIWQGHDKSINGSSHVALVLEETSNHLYMVDMHATKPDTGKGRWLLGVQKDYWNFHQVPASPDVSLMNGSTAAADNDVYLFKPYARNKAVRGQSHDSLAAVDQLMTDFLRANNVPGATVAVSRKGRLVLNKGYGFANVEEDRLMEPHHRSPIGSCSKILTAAGIFKLAESTDPQRAVSLDDRVYTLLASPEVSQGMAEGVINGSLVGAPDIDRLGRITLRHLLSHTGGLAKSADDLQAAIDYRDGSYEHVTYPDTMRWFLANLPLVGSPGEKTSYSNHGMGLLGRVIEVRTGQSYEKFVQDNLLSPAGVAGMRINRPFWHQQTELDAKRYGQYQSGFPYQPSKYDGIPGPVSYRYSKSFHGSPGGWSANAGNLVRFLCAIDGFNTRPDVLPASSVETMKSIPYPNAEGDPFAHGWGYQAASGSTPEYWAHNGATGCGLARIVMYGDEINVAICVTSDGPDTLRDIERQVTSVVREAGEDGRLGFYNLWVSPGAN